MASSVITFIILFVFNLIFSGSYCALNSFAADQSQKTNYNISPCNKSSSLVREQTIPPGLTSVRPQPRPAEIKAKNNEAQRPLISTAKPQTGSISRVDYLALRLKYAQSEAYDPYDSQIINIRRQCETLIKEGKVKEAIRKAYIGLAKDKYNIQLLIILAASYHKLNNIKQAEKYTELWRGLFNSIIAGANGKSPEAAFKVINLNEEYAVLMVQGLERVSQRLIERNGSNFDILTVRDSQTGKTFDLYFNVDIPLAWLAKKIETEKKAIKPPKKVKVK